MKKRLLSGNQNKGSALIVAIAASLIIMVLALSLLLLSYSVFYSASEETGKIQCREMAYSVSQELQNAMTVEFETYTQQRQALESGENPLWFFVRYHIRQEDTGRIYFKLESENDEISKYADRILVTVYRDEKEGMQDADFKEDMVLHVKVEVFLGEEYFANDMSFFLEVSTYEDAAGVIDINENLEIDAGEKWKWVRI